MRSQRLNRLSTLGLVALSLTALLTVLPFAWRAVLTGHIPPPTPDEGTGAHIFQLSIVAFVPMSVLFFATADWTRPMRSARLLILPVAVLLLAFCILYYFERVYYPAHY